MTPKSKLIITISAALLSAALIALFIYQFSDQPVAVGKQVVNVNPDEVLTFDCEFPLHKPDYITLTCADGGMTVEEVKWQSWGPKEAVGTGIYAENNCQPDCASGKLIKTPVAISITSLTEYKSKFYLKNLVITPTSGKNFPRGNNVIRWNLMEFAEKGKLFNE
jgi:hypothetical protein